MNKKLFVFDMDGTILNSKEYIQPATIKGLKAAKAQGHIAVIATGRPFFDAAKSLGGSLDNFDYIICNNGTYDYNTKSKEFSRNASLPFEIIDQVFKIGEENHCAFALHGSQKAKRAADLNYFNIKGEEFEDFRKFEKELVSMDEIIDWAKTQDISQISLRHNIATVERILPLFESLKDKVDIHVVNDVYIDVNGKGISKMKGLEIVATKLDISIANVVAFGDSGNDLDMLKGVGLGICMSNGNQVAKDIADEVIGDNNSDAIGEKILEIIRGEENDWCN